MMLRVGTFGLLLCSCSSPPLGVAADGGLTDDLFQDGGASDDAAASLFGPTLVFDDVHIAGLLEDAHSFSLLGEFINTYLTTAVEDGTLLLGIELRGLTDLSGQSSESITVGMYSLDDADGDPSDNFDPDAPETYGLGVGSFVGDTPTLLFDDAATSGGDLEADGLAALELLGTLGIALQSPSLEGTLVPTDDGQGIRTLEDGRLDGAVPTTILAISPNLLTGTCPGSTMLDVLASGCGTGFSLQPDVDIDGDGLERYYDTAGDGDAGTTDGQVDKCVDGDGTEILGTDCPFDARMQDGYLIIFVVHGVRSILVN